MEKMIAAVRAHASANYNTGGWDYVVECWEDGDIQDILEEDGAKTDAEAIQMIGAVMKMKDDHRKDIQATAF